MSRQLIQVMYGLWKGRVVAMILLLMKELSHIVILVFISSKVCFVYFLLTFESHVSYQNNYDRRQWVADEEDWWL